MHFLFTGLSRVETEPVITCTRIACEDPKEFREFVLSYLPQNCVTEAGGAPCPRWYGHCRLSWAGSSSLLPMSALPSPCSTQQTAACMEGSLPLHHTAAFTAGARQHKQHFPLPYPFLCLRSLGYLFSPV